MLKLILSIVLIAFLKYVLLCYFYQSKGPAQKDFILVLQKDASTFPYIAQTRELCYKRNNKKNCILQPMSVSCSLQCRPQLLWVKSENPVCSSFRNENSSLEINVSHFGVLYWQQWQPSASASDVANVFSTFIKLNNIQW